MKTFREKELRKLGFKKTVVPTDESGAELECRYYTFDLGKDACLISSCFEEGVDEVTVEFFEGNTPLSREFILACAKEFGNG